MPRKPIERSRSNYYHVTARSNNREFFYLPISNVWEIMTRKLAILQRDRGIKIAAFVLMNNHFHLLVLTPDEDIDRIMYFFMKEVTVEIQKSSSRINKIFGGRYKGAMIETYGYLVNVYKYILRNPIEVGLAEKAESYQYSSYYYQNETNGRPPFRIEKIIPSHAFHEYENLNESIWINQKFSKEESASISCGLQKTIFMYERDRASGKPIIPVVRHPRRKTQKELWDEFLPSNDLELRLLPNNG